MHEHEVRAQAARRTAPVPRQPQPGHELEEAHRQAPRTWRQSEDHTVELPGHRLHLREAKRADGRVLQEKIQVARELTLLNRARKRRRVPHEAERELLLRRHPVLGDLEHKADHVQRPRLERLHLRIDALAARPHEAIVVHVHRHRQSQNLLRASHLDDAPDIEQVEGARRPGRPEIRTRVEVQVLHVGVGRAEEPEEEERPHIRMEWQVEEGVRHIADLHERVSGEEPTDLLEGSEGEP